MHSSPVGRLVSVSLLTTLAVFGFSARAEAGTPEETALRLALTGHGAEAIGVLEKTGDPDQRWLAGRYGLLTRNFGPAERLLSGPSARDVWGRIDLSAARGDVVGAAAQALKQMDAAMSGTHRDALAEMLVGWAKERATATPDKPADLPNAAAFLRAALGLEPSGTVREIAEDALFRLPSHVGGEDAAQAARLRIANAGEKPAGIAATLRFAIDRESVVPGVAARTLAEIVSSGERADAMVAADELVKLGIDARIPDAAVTAALDTLVRRFPAVGDEDPARVRFAWAEQLARLDEAAGLTLLRRIQAEAEAGPARTDGFLADILEARADATTDAAMRRSIWLELSEREGKTARGDAAREEALDALLEAATTPALAAEAQKTPDGAGNPTLRYRAIPAEAEGAPHTQARTDALWALAASFNNGEWCDELGDRLVVDGVDLALAERFAATCPSASSVGAAMLQAHAGGQTTLQLDPTPRGLKVLASNAPELHVSQHRVDAEAFFRSTAGDGLNPLDHTLDAFLLEPDLAWEVPQTGLKAFTLLPRGGGNLVALTVRAADQRATALVVADPLDVQILRRGDDTAIAVLHGGKPATGAELFVEDDGEVTKVRTGGDGIARLKTTGVLRVMARSGGALGFSTATSGQAPDVAAETCSVVLWDRAAPVEGGVRDVDVFCSGDPAAKKGAADTVEVSSTGRAGQDLERRSIVLRGGYGHERLMVQGGGQLGVTRDGEPLASAQVPTMGENQPPVAVTFSSASPSAGASVRLHVQPLVRVGPGGLAASVTVNTPWSTVTTEQVLTGAGLDVPVNLAAANPGDEISVGVRLPDGRTASSSVRVAAAAVPGALTGVPTIVGVGQTVAVKAGDRWLRASGVGTGSVRWTAPGVPLVLPASGAWELSACLDATCGPGVELLAVQAGEGDVAADGTWAGAPALTALTAGELRSARILKAGDRVLPPVDEATRGAATPWLVTPSVILPVRGEEAPAIEVRGGLARGERSAVTIEAPAGSRVWAWLRDAPDARQPQDVVVASLWSGEAGITGDPWLPTPVWGQAIAAGLLAEEERLAEGKDLRRVDFGFSADAEESEKMEGYGMGASGSGMGGGGTASGVYGLGTRGRNTAPLFGDAVAIGVVSDAAPGSFSFDVPRWIADADLQVVTRTADGRWASRTVRLDVGGEAITPVLRPPSALPETWSGDPAVLLALASTLPTEARAYAMAALADERRPGGAVPGALPAFEAALAVGLHPGPELSLVHRLREVPAREVEISPIPDPQRASRALAALTVAGTDPERARVAAGRLLDEADAEPWVRSRAALALWVAHADDEALAAAAAKPELNPGDAARMAATRAVVSGAAEPAFAASWWSTARSEGAGAMDRALAIHALALLPSARRGVTLTAGPAGPPTSKTELSVVAEPPLAEWRGEVFNRGRFSGSGWLTAAGEAPGAVTEVPAERWLPLQVTVPPSALPSRLACPAGATPEWVDLPPSLTEPRVVECRALTTPTLETRWFDPGGELLSSTKLTIQVGVARDSLPDDALSDLERLTFGTRLAAAGDPAGVRLLEELQNTADLPPAQVRAVNEGLLQGARIVAARARPGDTAPSASLIRAFQSFREHVPAGELDLATASAVAHAYAEAPVVAGVAGSGDPARALAATRVVMDARFKEELAAVSQLQANGLDLTALKLLRELLLRYPETPTVVRARYLAPAMLLTRADGDGDRLGYTRSSLRHTAAAELAGFLLLHSAESTPETGNAAALLSEALHSLGDGARERALAGPLASAFRGRPGTWRLSLADARARLAGGQAAAALALLDTIEDNEAQSEKELERGHALEALGRLKEAEVAYGRSSAAEAYARLGWFARGDLAPPSVLVLTPGTPLALPADLPRGAEITITAIAIQLEAAMLSQSGTVDPGAIEVAGLRPTASRTVSVGPDGDVPLPTLPDGAYLVTITSQGTARRFILVRTDAELTLQPGSGTLVHLATTAGTPLAGAQLWMFDGSGVAHASRTDGTGSAWSNLASSAVLARVGDRYALWRGGTGEYYPPPSPPPYPYEDNAPAAAPARMQKTEMDYDDLFRQDANQKVQAQGL